MKLRVLNIVSGDLWGGAEAQVLLQGDALRRLGWDVQMLLFNSGETYSRYRDADFPCHIIAECGGRPVLGGQLAAALHSIAPDVVVTHGYKENAAGCYLRLRHGCPWIATFHGVGEQYGGLAQVKMAAYLLVSRWLCRFAADRLIAVSASLAEQVHFDGLSKLEVIHNVSPAVMPAPGEAALAGQKSNVHTLLQRPAFLAVGRLARVKRFDLAISAFERLFLREIREGKIVPHLYLVGDGPERAALTAMSAESSVSQQIHLLGFRDDAANLIAQADVLLIPSDSEGVPTVLLEAMSAVTPVVATAVGGIPETLALIPQYPARLARPGDVEGFSEAMAAALVMEPAAAARGGILALFRKHFAPEVAAHRLDAIYRSVIGK